MSRIKATVVKNGNAVTAGIEVGNAVTSTVEKQAAITASVFIGNINPLLYSHAARHEDGGADEIDVTGLSGLLDDPQTPLPHAASHAEGASDVLNVANLGSGAAASGTVATADGTGGVAFLTASGGGGGSVALVVADTNQTLSGFPTIDGVLLVDGDRPLLVGQTDASENGVWEAHVGVWTRPTDWVTGEVESGSTVALGSEGTVYSSTEWIVATDDPIVVDTTNVTIIRLSLAQRQRIYPFGVQNPVTNDDIPRWFVPRDFRVDEIRATKFGGTGTFDWELRHSVNANDQGAGTLIESDTGVNNETTGVQYLPPFNPGNPTIIPAGNWVWLELPAVSTGLARPVAMLVQMIGTELGT